MRTSNVKIRGGSIDEGETMKRRFNAGGVAMAAVALCIILSSGGCTFLELRQQDLSDAVYFHGGVGLGLEAHVSVISGLAQLGVGGHVSQRTGSDGWQHGSWKEKQVCVAFPLFLGMFYVDKPEHTDGVIRVPTYFSCVGGCISNRFVVGPEAGVFLGAVGVEAGIDIIELADFFTGWFGLDLLSDDVVDVESVLSDEWWSPRYRGRVFFRAMRKMSDEQLVGFIKNTQGPARILVFKELQRRGIPGRLDLMIEHFDFRWFNTNEADIALEVLKVEVERLDPCDPRVDAVQELGRRDPDSLGQEPKDGE
jgi:hypothetical protein